MSAHTPAVLRAARALCKANADVSRVSEEFVADAEAALTAAGFSELVEALQLASNVLYLLAPEVSALGLSAWRWGSGDAQPDCGTVACFGGWCAWWPSFQQQGVTANPLRQSRAPWCMGEPVTGWCGEFGVARYLFGDDRLFHWRDAHSADRTFSPYGSDHELVTHRLRWLLENSVVQGSAA